MDSPEGLYFYVTSFWTSKLFRTSGFLVILVRRHVQLFHFHHCKRHLKKPTIALDPFPPSVRCVRSWKWWQLWTTTYTYLSWTQSNYNRASDAPVRVCVCVCVCVCVHACVRVCKSTPRTADITITKIAGYVRVAFSWIGDFFVFLPFIVFKFLTLFTRRVHMHLHAHSYAAPMNCARVRSIAIGRRVHKASQQCWGCHCGPGATQLK